MTEVKQIESLTPEQEAMLPVHRAKYMKIGWSTAPSDRARAERGMTALYARTGRPAPEFVWVKSPLAAVKLIKEETDESVVLSGTDGCLDAYWLAFYTFAREIKAQIKEDDSKQLDEWADVIESTGPCYPYEKKCVMTERPEIATYDDNELLHGEYAPALRYRDGFEIFAHHNIRVPKQVIMEPWTLTQEQIEKEQNTDLQTIMQELWCYEEKDSAGDRVGAGGGRWLAETDCKVLHEDTYVSDTTEYKTPAAAKKAAKAVEALGGTAKILEDGITVETHIARALLEDKAKRRYLMSGDGSTNRIYYIRCDNKASTCSEAQFSIEGIPESKLVGRG